MTLFTKKHLKYYNKRQDTAQTSINMLKKIRLPIRYNNFHADSNTFLKNIHTRNIRYQAVCSMYARYAYLRVLKNTAFVFHVGIKN